MRRWLVRLSVLAALGYGAVVGLLWAMQERMIYPGWRGPSAEQVAAVPGLEEIRIEGEVSLRAWVRTADPGRPTVLIFHGNAGTQWSQLQAFAARGWGLVLPSYRGFAGNPGEPTEAGLHADARAVLAHLPELALASEDVVLYGESLGTGVAARVAAEVPGWRALVLDTPYTSVADTAAERYPWIPVRALIRHEFDTAGLIDRIEAPILILHGTADRVIPFSHGQALAALVPEARTVWFEGGGHLLPAEPVAEAVAAFVEEVG